MTNRYPQLRIVLVRPRNPLNLLAASRAAANFGFEDVLVVAPYEPTWEEALAAPEAARWMRRAQRVANLATAIAECDWVLGTSCLARRRLPPEPVLSLDQVIRCARRSRHRRVALLFGSEKRGLRNQDLELCHAVVRIPASAETPSMNLAQAVAVCCYELRRWGAAPPEIRLPFRPPATAGEISRLVESLGRLLSGNPATVGKERRRQARLRRLLLKIPLTSEEIALLLGVVRDLARRLPAAERGGPEVLSEQKLYNQ